MATQGTPMVPMGEAGDAAGRGLPRPWPMAPRLSSLADRAEAFLERASLDRGPWLGVAFAAGIGSWFALAQPWQWQGTIGLAVLVAIAATSRWRGRDGREALLLAVVGVALAFAVGLGLVWARSTIVGVPPLDSPRFGVIEGRVLEREERPGEDRLRLVLAYRDAREARAVKVRVNLSPDQDVPGLSEGAVVRLRARLMPPSPPIVPGGYDFARTAWFSGLAATGSALGAIEVIAPAEPSHNRIGGLQRALSHHVRQQLDGAAGALAATLASGDRGAIPPEDEVAMRDAGLTHLLSISGVHVSAVMAVCYALIFRFLAAWPWVALRYRVPVMAAAGAALGGIAYTLLTGAEVPTVRSCVGALLVLVALVLGREPLSMRLVAVAACVVLILWPESLIGPSFQMSFAAVLAIVALHQSRPVKAFLAPREESWLVRMGRRTLMLLLTGIVIELVLTPIVVFHFHRTGLYGALANIFAIPLVTFVSMPLVALALLLDVFGLGALAWWLAGLSLDALLWLAHSVASAPHAVTLVPQVDAGWMVLFAFGALWLALWQGRVRLWGLVPASVGALAIILARPPDVLVTRDGNDLAISGQAAGLPGMVVLRAGSPTGYARETLAEISANPGPVLTMAGWQQARCSRDFCRFVLKGADREWSFLVARSRNPVEERALAAACAASDIVIADRWLPRSCAPRWLKADRELLEKEGGLALYLSSGRLKTVRDGQGQHGWWQEPQMRRERRR